jgi:hypothetical protein
MNVEIGAEAALFPDKEYINGIAVAVYRHHHAFPNIMEHSFRLFLQIMTTFG